MDFHEMPNLAGRLGTDFKDVYENGRQDCAVLEQFP